MYTSPLKQLEHGCTILVLIKCYKSVYYFDGHEREDVTEYRKEFVDRMFELDRKCIYPGHTPQLRGEKPVIQIHHDESTFYANADQSKHWGDGTMKNILKQKSLGQAIMVSDFVEENGSDYLRYNGQEARLVLETSTDGYSIVIYL